MTISQPLNPPVAVTPELQGMLDSLPQAAILLGRDYRIMAANPDYIERYGDGRALQHRHCYSVSHRYQVPCDQAGESCPLRQSLATGSNSEVLHVHHTPRGEEYVHVEMRPIKHPGTGVVQFFIEIMHPTSAASATAADEGLVGRSRPFQRMVELVERVASTDTTVMLFGESGTGKELVAKTLHRLSQRADAVLVPVECTGMPEALFESELFGYTKGAFTGATRDKPGLVDAASGGTLFLDEVGDIPLSVQVKLLRLLETRRYRRVGGTDWLTSDFRLVAATHRDLKTMVARGEFREDLYYRLCVFDITLPALRERRDDLVPLIDTLFSHMDLSEPPTVSAAAMQVLRAYPFPGNVRELRNALERAALLTDDGEIRPEHLPPRFLEAPAQPTRDQASGTAAAAVISTAIPAPAGILPLAEVEQRYLKQVLENFTGDRRALAQHLGISERALYRRLAALRP